MKQEIDPEYIPKKKKVVKVVKKKPPEPIVTQKEPKVIVKPKVIVEPKVIEEEKPKKKLRFTQNEDMAACCSVSY